MPSRNKCDLPPRRCGKLWPSMTLKNSVRTAVLDAAIRLVQDSEMSALTLDAVAAKAGVSKGGLLHYFNNKEALLTAMVARVLENFEEDHRRALEEIGFKAPPPLEHEAELLRHYLGSSFVGLGANYKSAMILFAVAANQRNLLQPIRAYFAARTQETLAHSANPPAALALTLLADGLWLFDALDIPPFAGEVRAQVQAYIDDLIQRELAPKRTDMG